MVASAIDRRRFLAALAALAAGGAQAGGRGFAADIEVLEQDSGGRLGVCVLDAHTGVSVAYRGDERFGMCSTFKLPLAALVLKAIDDGELAADLRIPIRETDMVFYAPVTEKYVGTEGLTVVELAEAAQKTSDNPAANLLLRRLGGPDGFTARLRKLGDEYTRLDRYETEMNLVAPGEVRDTTTPAAMAVTVARLLDESFLSAASRRQLESWLVGTRTGLSRLRAGFPAEWRAGDKTGTGIAPIMPNRTNDVATVWLDDRLFVVAAYAEADGHYKNMRPEDSAVLAAVGERASRWIAERAGQAPNPAYSPG